MNKPSRAQQKIRVFLKDGTLLTTLDWKKCTTRPAGTEPVPAKVATVSVEVGATMADGSVFAGLTADGSQRIYTMPRDLDVAMTFNNAAEAVATLNSQKTLSHDDWHIGSLEVTRVLQKNQNEGALKGTLNTSGNKGSGGDFSGWYWSSTEVRVGSPCVRSVRFSNGYEDWSLKDNLRLSCRPVRLVAASARAPAPR
jgi:hypothetical protein